MINKILTFLFILQMYSCSSIKPINAENEEVISQNVVKIFSAPDPTQITVLTGKVAYKEFDLNVSDGLYHLLCGNKKFPMYVTSHKAQVYISANYFSPEGTTVCEFEYKQKRYPLISVTIAKYNYPSERLYVDKKKVFYSKKDIERIIKEKKIKKEIYKESAQYFYFDEPFMIPLNSKITSYYGNKRLFNDKKQSQHLGNDLRAAVGVKIPSSNKGKIVYTGNLFFSGNVVVIDHGLNIFTIYAHLSKIFVRKGDMVLKGDIVGLGGMSGRVSGPHLHWGVKVNGSNIDGFKLVEESKKQFTKQ